MLEQGISIFNNREVATIVWSVVLLVWVFIKQPNFYRSLLGLLVAVAKMWKFFLPMLIYVALSIFALYKLNLWDSTLLKITLFWFFGWAVVMFANSMKIGKEKGYLKKIIFELVGLTVFISFISNLYSFSLMFELFLVPFVALLAGISAVESFNQENNMVGKLTNNILIFLGLVIFIVSLYKTIVYFGDFASMSTLQEFLIPILLSFMFIPFACGLSIYSHWEQKRIMKEFRKSK